MKFSALVVFGLMAVALAQELVNEEEEDRQAADDEAEWNNFKNKHKKKYKDKKEEKRRQAKFAQRHKKIKDHNAKSGKGKHKLRLNRFADWDDHELTALKAEIEPRYELPAPILSRELLNREGIPDSVDLRNHSCMPRVKFQGTCGSCYTFGAINPVEFQLCLKTGQLVTLSEENLIDCSQGQGNLGCNGGLALRAWNYMMANGINSNELYPYQGVEDTCKYSSSYRTAVLSGWAYATKVGDEEAIRAAVATYGPVAVSIDASGWEFYGSGVFSSDECSKTSTNHAVVIVGYGFDQESNKKYWIIRNSWDVEWGVGGYLLLERGVNMCAIGKRPVYPIVA